MNSPRMPQLPQQKSLRDIDFSYYIGRYTNLLWRKKWYILLSGPLTAAITFVVLFKTVQMTPELSTQLIIGVDNPQQVSAVSDFANIGASKMAALRSLNFLGDIVDSLSLRLSVPGYQRSGLFDSVHVDSLALPGKYELSTNHPREGQFTLFFTNEHLGYQEKTVETGLISTLDTIGLPGMHLQFTNDFLTRPEDLVFYVQGRRSAAASLQSRLSVQDRTREEGVYIVTLEGRDYPLIAESLNMIAETFVKQNQGFRRRRTRRALEILEKQLEKASHQLALSENALSSYLSQNPELGINTRLQETISDLSGSGPVDMETEMTLAEAKRVRSDLRQETEKVEQVLREALAFLQDNRYYRAAVISTELEGIQQELQVLSEEYTQSHPVLQEARGKMANIKKQTLDALNDFISRTEEIVGRREKQASRFQQQLRSLPQKQRRLAELQSRQTIDSELYSSILSRYNEAKVAEAAEIADFYIVDQAYPPLPPSNQMMLLQFLAISCLAGMTISLGPVILFDFLDRTARTEGDVERLVNFKVLEGIPVLETDKSPGVQKASHSSGSITQSLRRIDRNLVAADLSQGFVNETFKSLRTKLTLLLHDSSDKSIVVTSLNPNEGKSTLCGNIAISFAQQGTKTVLIDGDLRRGVLHNSFAVEKSPGLTDYVIGSQSLSEESLAELVQPTHVPNLHIITSGQNQPNPIELLVSEKFAQLRKTLASRYEVIIMDSPPLGVGTDAVVLNELFSRYILVAKAGKTNLVDLKKQIEEYGVLKEKVLGLVLNYADVRKTSKYYKNSSYYAHE